MAQNARVPAAPRSSGGRLRRPGGVKRFARAVRCRHADLPIVISLRSLGSGSRWQPRAPSEGSKTCFLGPGGCASRKGHIRVHKGAGHAVFHHLAPDNAHGRRASSLQFIACAGLRGGPIKAVRGPGSAPRSRLGWGLGGDELALEGHVPGGDVMPVGVSGSGRDGREDYA